MSITPPLSLIAYLKKSDPKLYAFLTQLSDTTNNINVKVNPAFVNTPVSSVVKPSISSQPFISTNNDLDLLVSFSFTSPNDTNWKTCQIWVSGYLGNSSYVYLTEGPVGPLSILMKLTGETVKFQFVSQNENNETNLNSGIVISYTLSKISTAPPAPTINSYLVSNAVGFSFSFNTEAGLLSNVIQAYKIYRNTSNNSSTASVIKVIPSSGINSSVYEFNDQVTSINTLYYWVSAVDTSGNESTLTPAFQTTINFDSSMGTVPIAKSQVLSVTNNLITTPSITANAVSSFINQVLGSSVQLTYNTWIDVMDVNFTPNGGNVLVFLDGQFENTSSNNVTIEYKMQKNGVDSGITLLVAVPFQTAGEFASFSFVRPDLSPGISQNKYSFLANMQLNVSNPVYCNALSVTVMNVKV